MQFFKRNPHGGCIALAIVWLASFQPASPEAKEKKLSEFDFHRNLTGILFDPVDFIINNALPIDLDESGVGVLLRKIHSRFDTIMVSVDVPPRYAGNFSNDQLPKIVARFNHKLFRNVSRSASDQHLKVAILINIQSWDETKMSPSRFQDVKNILNDANSIFPGTVQTVVLEVTNFTDVATLNYRDFREIFVDSATVGIKGNIKDAIETISSDFPIYGSITKKIITDRILGVLYITENFNDLTTGIPVTEVIAKLDTQFRRCKNLVQNLNNVTKLALVTTWPDTNEEGFANYTKFAEFWEGVNEWAEKSKTSTIFLQAFDTPLKSDPWTVKTSGWWRLLPSTSYDHPSQFVFEEKISLTEEKSPAENMTWLSHPIGFNKAVVGVHFSPFPLKSGDAKSKDDAEASLPIPILIEQISKMFSKVLVSTLYNDKESYLNRVGEIVFSVPGEVAKLNSKGCRYPETSMELIMTFDETTAENVSRSAHGANILFPATVSQLVYSPTTFEKGMLLDGYLAMINMPDEMKTLKLGVKLDLEVCNDQTRFSTVMNLLQEDFFSDIEINILYFSAFVSIKNTRLGSHRFLPLLTVMYENCKKRVDQYLSNQTESRGVEVAFITGWPINEEDNLDELVQYNLFWEGMSAWAQNTNTSVILSSAFDPPSSAIAVMQPGANYKYGFWDIKDRSTSSNLYDFQDKKEVAFQYAKKKLDDGKSDSSNLLTVVIPSISTVAIIVIVALLTVFYLLKKRQSNGLTKIEILHFFNGGDSTLYIGSPESVNGPYQKNDLEISKDSFIIDDASPLGSGEYGKVCRGTVRKDGVAEEVAVKMTKIPTKAFALRGLMFEIKILSYLGQHPHIVGLIGAYTAELDKNIIFVFLELCGLGSLQSYLRECKTSKKLRRFIEKAENCEDVGDRTDFDQEWYAVLPDIEAEKEEAELDDTLVNYMALWSREIANGMEFIASKHIVHLDLATRNVLLTSEKRAKITDFGLSRRMYDYQSYIKKHPEPLPWRSMAPESLKNTEFTEKSDVWAFGILLWEIYSLGDVPYPGLSWDVNFPTNLEQGLRPGEPTYNQDEMYSIMCLCWSTTPERRPTFSELVTLLKTTLDDSPPTSSEINNTCSISNTMEKSVEEIKNECEDNNDSNVPQPGFQDQDKIPRNGRWMWPSMAVVWLLIIVALSIIWSLWGVGVLVKSSEDVCIPYQEEVQNGSVTTSSPIEAGNGHARSRNRTVLGLKLFIAIAGDGRKEDAVKALVNLGADVNVRHELFHTPLISASNCSSDKSICLRIIEILIENGADVYARDGSDRVGNTFLQKFFAAALVTLTPPQFHQITAYLISKNMSKLFASQDPNSLIPTPLELAITYMEVENRTLLLLYENDVTFNDTMAKSNILENAIIWGRSPELISTLIELGANWRYLDDYHNNSLLHTAAAYCYPEEVEYFLHKGLRINVPNKFGQTPLHLAVQCKNDEQLVSNVMRTVRVLVDYGANVCIRDNDARAPFSILTERNDLSDKADVIEILREADSFNFDNLTKEGLGQKLFDAIEELNEENVKLLVQFGADLNVRTNPHGETPLMRVVNCCSYKKGKSIRFRIIKFLITNGADMSVPKSQSENVTFVHYFVNHFYPLPSQFHEVIGFLPSTNSSKLFNMKKAPNNQSLFQEVIFNIAVEIRTLNLLYEHGVDFKWKDNLGESTLYYAVSGDRSVELLSRLIEFGVDWKSRNKRNQTLLHEAAKSSLTAVKFFLTKGLDVNAQDVEGFTPLHNAIRSCDKNERILETVKALIENGADAEIKDKQGDTPLDIALKDKCDRSVILLFQEADLIIP